MANGNRVKPILSEIQPMGLGDEKPSSPKKAFKKPSHPPARKKAERDLAEAAGVGLGYARGVVGNPVKDSTEETPPPDSKIRSLWKKAVGKAGEFAHHEYTTKVVNVSDSLLKVAVGIGQAKLTGPVAALTLGISAIGKAQEYLPRPEEGEEEPALCDVIKQKHGLVKESLKLADFIYRAVRKSGKLKRIGTEGTYHYDAIFHEDGSMVVFEIIEDTKTDYDMLKQFIQGGNHGKISRKATGEFTVQSSILRSPHYDYSRLADYIWAGVDANVVMVGHNNQIGELAVDYDMISHVDYLGSDHNPTQFWERTKIFQDRGISRGAVFVGPPGLGKTSLVKALCVVSKGRMLTLTVDSINRLTSSEMKNFVHTFQPSIVLFDDVERVEQIDKLLHVVEEIRNKYPRTLIVATVNDPTEIPSALLRPGRLGEMIAFNAPSLMDRIELLQFYMDKYGADQSKYNIEALCRKMTHPFFSHDYVRFVAEQSIVMEQDELLAHTVTLNKQVALVTASEFQGFDAVEETEDEEDDEALELGTGEETLRPSDIGEMGPLDTAEDVKVDSKESAMAGLRSARAARHARRAKSSFQGQHLKDEEDTDTALDLG